MDDNTAKVLMSLAEAVGKSGKNVVDAYTIWYFRASVVWALFGAVLVYLGVKIKSEQTFFKDFNHKHEIATAIKWVTIIIGLLILFNNICDLLAPQGIAIHQLIKDLRP